MTHFLILLRNLQPKKVHGKPGQAVLLLPATKKTCARASASPHYIQAELLHFAYTMIAGRMPPHPAGSIRKAFSGSIALPEVLALRQAFIPHPHPLSRNVHAPPSPGRNYVPLSRFLPPGQTPDGFLPKKTPLPPAGSSELY